MFRLVDYSHSADRLAVQKTPSKKTTNFKQKKVTLHKFVGATYRSNKGCLCCRKRRRKCDETRPECIACVKRNVRCIWREVGAKSPVENPSKRTESTAATSIFSDGQELENQNSTLRSIENFIVDEEDNLLSENSTLIEVSASEPSVLELASETGQLVTREKNLPTQLLTYKGSTNEVHFPLVQTSFLTFFLDAKTTSFVRHFEQKVSGSLVVSPRTSNYFCKTFLLLAYTDESIGHALASWGAFYMHQHHNEDVQGHLMKAINLTSKRFPRGASASSYDYFTLLCFHLIMLGFFVCQGDVSQWWTCFYKCYELILRFGGLRELSSTFHASNDIKFLISNFFYHDILASHAFLNGPLVKVSEYRDIFENGFFESNYGIDPLQGCLNPVYLLLAEELEVKATMREYQLNLKLLLDEDPQELNEPLDAHLLRAQYLEFCHDNVRFMEQKIFDCAIDDQLLKDASENEIELHNKAFALFKTVCELYWVLHLKECSPKSWELQRLLLCLFDHIEELQDTQMILILCLPLLMAGLVCFTKHDRSRMTQLFTLIIQKCPVHNVRRAWLVVQELWKRNTDGDKLLDWAEICRDFGWQLCVC